MKLIWKNIIIVCTSLILLIVPMNETQSCWFDEFSRESYRCMLFQPAVIADERFETFYYTTDFLNNRFTDNESDYQRNCAEWQNALGRSFLKEDIYEVLYKIEATDFIRLYENDSLHIRFRENRFVSLLQEDINTELLAYLILALKTQEAQFKPNPWNRYYIYTREDTIKRDQRINNWQSLNKSFQALLKHTRSDFVKERCAYQLVVNYRYAEDYENCIAIFDTYLANSPSILKAWASIHKAHALYQTKRQAEANLALAYCFSHCESKKIRASNGFVHRLLEPTLALTKTAEEKVWVYALAYANNPGRALAAIQTIVTHQPDYEYLPLLIVREINKLEDWLLSPFLLDQQPFLETVWDTLNRPRAVDGDSEATWSKYYDWEDKWKEANTTNYNFNNDYYAHKNYQKDIAYLRDFRTSLLKWSANPVARKHADFLNLAISYLYFLDFDFQKSYDFLEKVSNNTAVAVQAQVHTQKVLLIPKLKDITTHSTQAELFHSLDWLDEHSQKLPNWYKSESLLHLYLAKAFFKKGKMTEAGLLYTQTRGAIKGGGGNLSDYYSSIVFFDKYASIDDIDKVFAFLEKTNKTAFEQYLLRATYFLNNYEWSKTDNRSIRKILFEQEEKKELERQKRLEAGEIEMEIPRTSPPPPPPPPPLPSGYEETVQYTMWDTSQQGFRERLYDVQGTIAFRQDSLERAIKAFSKLPKTYWREVYEFDKYIKDPFDKYSAYYSWDTDANAMKSSQYRTNKLKIVERMLQLRENGSPDSLLLLGEAYLDCMSSGNSWMMFAYGKYPNEAGQDEYYYDYDYSFFPNAIIYDAIYYHDGRARKYFQQVLDHPEANKHQKLWALYHLGDTNWDGYWSNDLVFVKDEYRERYIPNEFFRIKKEYEGTSDYNFVMSCLSLDD